MFTKPGFPQMYFIENRYSNDPTNWWIPNAACMEAMLRSAGFEITDHPEQEVYICRRGRNNRQAAPCSISTKTIIFVLESCEK